MQLSKIAKIIPKKAPNRVILFLQESPLFENLNSNELIKLRKILRINTYNSGETIITPDSQEKGIFLILVGKVHILKKIKGKKYNIVTELERGDYFGEFNFLDKPFENVLVKASTNLEAFYLSQKEFETLKKTDPKTSIKILFNLTRIIGERLIKVNSDYLEMFSQNNFEKQ